MKMQKQPATSLNFSCIFALTLSEIIGQNPLHTMQYQIIQFLMSTLTINVPVWLPLNLQISCSNGLFLVATYMAFVANSIPMFLRFL